MAHIPIDLPDQSIHIHAQRELAFEVISALGSGASGMASAGDMAGGTGARKQSPTSVVLEEDGDRMLVEFRSHVKIGPISTTWKTTEWVLPEKPVSISFELVPDHGIITGGLRQLTDHFDFEKQGNCTVLTYKSRFGIRWSVGGWLLGKALIGPIIKKHMIEHLGEVKEMIESRAGRSRLYPQLECDEGDEDVEVGKDDG
ncbi:MAG: hypothetical protein E2O75_08655 [Chloroflexi bacterium]|nr:MAG: hypothetical protein E2O75_08655 [Chloroflexota bacterium]